MKYFMSDLMVFSMTVLKYICKSQKLVIQVSLNLIMAQMHYSILNFSDWTYAFLVPQ